MGKLLLMLVVVVDVAIFARRAQQVFEISRVNFLFGALGPPS